MFIKLLVTQEDCLSTLESITRLKQFPVVMYGGGVNADSLTKFLKRRFHLKIDAYFVDEQYLSSKHVIDNVGSLKQIKCKFKMFNIVCGFEYPVHSWQQRVRELVCDQVNSIYIYDYSAWEVFDSFNLLYIQENQEIFQTVYDCLSDELSKKVFVGYINAKLTLELSHLQNLQSTPQYFPDDLPSFYPSDNEVFVDGGAYDGDTLRTLLSKTNGIGCHKYYAFEPDTQNYQRLSSFLLENDIQFVEAFQQGLWSVQDTLYFRGNCGMASVIVDSGEMEIKVNAIDNLDAEVTFIKMDIEGAELEALKGASETIRKYKPKLAISLYHHPQHLTEIPLFIKSLCPDYSFFLRIHSFYSRELILYAVAH